MLPHPYANLFPTMKGSAFQELVASIRNDGLEQPIVTFEGKILDGRNRAAACANAQVTSTYVKDKGDDPLGFVIRHNLTRKHLTTSQRGLVADKLANLEKGDNQHTGNPTSQATAAEMLNVSVDTVQQAKKLRETGDEELIEAEGQKLLRLWDKTSADGRAFFLRWIGAD
ncbi:ParB N-terminal domain-containing protein [Sneathiella sp.]|uniref:ParB N-terminal domain-containing protein n=1 Tax=Sneathiella sp. TaxID=1964365 RepID=UPI00356B5513